MYHHILGSFVDVLAFFIELFILFIQEEGYSKETSFGNSAVIKLDELHDFIPSYLAKGWAASWLARSGSVAPQQVLSSILIRSEFPAVGVKKPLDVLAARLGPLGHGPGFEGFIYPGKPVWLPLNEKMVESFPPPGRVFS